MHNMQDMQKDSTVYVAGHRGLAGSALVRKLQAEGYENILTRTHAELDLEDQKSTEDFFAEYRPEYVFLAAAKVGGLFANKTHPAEFITQNLRIQTNVIDAAYRHGCKKFMFLGSSCIYPRISDRLIKEEDLLSAPLEKTNEAYAIAKIAGLKMCAFYREQYAFDAIAIMPPNLHGPNDNFDPNTAHVLQGLMVRMTHAKERGEKEFVIWGTGTPRREFLYIDDMADAALFLMQTDTKGETLFNVGTGDDISVKDLAAVVKDIVGFDGELVQDTSKADGTPRKTMDVTRLNTLGWKATLSFEEGVRRTFEWFMENRPDKKDMKKASAA